MAGMANVKAILPSEKAFAYKMKMEALKRQDKRRDLTSEPAVPKLTAREKIAQDAGENCGLTITRYIALTKLISPLLTLVDEDKLSFSTAADYIAILTEQEQTILASEMDKLGVIATRSQLVKIKKQRRTEVLTITVIEAILSEGCPATVQAYISYLTRPVAEESRLSKGTAGKYWTAEDAERTACRLRRI